MKKKRVIMKRIIFCLIVIINSVYSQPENPGSFQAGWISATLNRDGRTINTVIYYPAISEGSGAQIDTSNGPYSIVAFGHGFFMQNNYYISLFKHLASYGHIVIAPQFPDNNHLQLGFDLLFCANHLKNESRNPNSIFYRLVDTAKVGLSGHSMGGGASLLAAANDSTVDVVAPLAAAETNPSAISVMNKIKAVVYLITAQNDGVTPPANHQIPMYNNALPIKGIPTLKGANHTKFMDTRLFDWTDPRGYLTPAEQLRLTRRYLTSIFNLFLKEDSSYFKYAFGTVAQNDTSIILERQLKPLRPKPFGLISPNNFSFINQKIINFNWNSTYSLNLNDVVRYKIVISRDSTFNTIFFTKDSISSTNYQHLFEEDGKFYWKVIAYTSDSTFTQTNFFSFIILLAGNEDKSFTPQQFKLEQNYPNPFGGAINSSNTETTIKFDLPTDSKVLLEVYNIVGEKVATLINQDLSAGFHNINFSGKELSTGVYFYKLSASDFTSTKKFIFIR